MSTDDTAASEHGADAETTQVPPPPGDEPELAWSNDETDEIQSTRHGRIVSAGLIALVVAVAVALIWLAATYFGHGPTKTSKPSAIPTTTAMPAPPPVVAPPPATVTVTPPPVQPSPAPMFTTDMDQRLLTQLAAQDYTITDAAEVIQHAHRYCTLVQQGTPPDNARQTVASEALSAKPVGDEIGIESRRFWSNEIDRTNAAYLDISIQAMNGYYPNCGTHY